MDDLIVAGPVARVIVSVFDTVDRHPGVEVADEADDRVLVVVKLPQLGDEQLEGHHLRLRECSRRRKDGQA